MSADLTTIPPPPRPVRVVHHTCPVEVGVLHRLAPGTSRRPIKYNIPVVIPSPEGDELEVLTIETRSWRTRSTQLQATQNPLASSAAFSGPGR
ncbi:hypothetical protein MGYG_05366 [Nannizzia gypsea CBS 118893]|uniref:Uncharacterized protein n=1 Tax=Arthroderma gypseum (strain ATCC MYA-4604 / CBS 118893) TaxID=535722 RepID=E4UVP3_ARTGP|nr:hypothetical protein MGYG_05366 [Nannizzia gypsea CBS 118893]EFR02370.1 hypothetical protein MGYG_05366 [Nannizzia gypsea CBS 118893]